VREHPPQSGRWRGRLPTRLDPHRRYIDGIFDSKRECRLALNQAITDLDSGRAPKPTAAPTPGAPTRRVRQVVEEYIVERRTDPFDPLGLNTVRDYNEILRNVIGREYADIGGAAVRQLDPAAIADWFGRLRTEGVAPKRAMKGLALLRTALSWEVASGRLTINPAREVARRRPTTKSGRNNRVTADPVLLPSWKELALLACHPERLDDRLLLLTMAWAGLRWSEAVGLSVFDVWPERPRLSVRRTFARNAEDGLWHVEAVKGGNADILPLPRPLWEALRDLASTRPVEDRDGGDLLFRPTRSRDGRPTVVIETTNWRKRVWLPARDAAGLIGDPRLSHLDPRHRALKVKDLRAYAASVIVDAGGTPYEAAALLRHANVQTTNRFYARAQDERSHDAARAKLRINHDLSLSERIDALWVAWMTAYPELTSDLLRSGLDAQGLW
jgi:integrase